MLTWTVPEMKAVEPTLRIFDYTAVVNCVATVHRGESALMVQIPSLPTLLNYQLS